MVVVGEGNAPSVWGEICGKQMWDDMRHKQKKTLVANESADGKHGTCGMTNHPGMQCVANEQIVKLKSHTKLSPNFLTLPENLRRGQIVGDTSSQHFSQSTSSKYVHCSALIVTDVGRNMGGGLHLPHGPKLLARQLAKRRGIPRNSRCKKEYGCPWDGTVYEVSSCPTRCLYWVTVMYLPACKSSISRALKSIRKRAQTVSIGFRSPVNR